MINISVSNFIIAIPEIYIATIAFVVLIFGMLQRNTDYNSRIIFFNKISYVAILGILLSIILIYSVGDTYVETFNSLFLISPIVYIFKIVIIIITVLILVISRRYLIDIGIFSYEYIVVMMLLLCGNMLMLSSNDFISFYVSFELVSICSYVLIFMNRHSVLSNESGIKYFILGSLGTGFLLYGISLIYGFTGETNFVLIKAALNNYSNNWIIIIGLVMLIVGIGFKLSLVPFHMWTQDVYKGSYMPITLLLSTVLKISVLFIFIRILWEPLLPLFSYWQGILEILIILSAIVGFTVAIFQTNIKSFIAYSSIGNISYMLMGILISSQSSVINIILYAVSYSVALIGFTSIVMLLKRNDKVIEDIYDFKGLSKNYPYIAFTLAVFLLSMAGLPISAGFFGKLFILYSVIEAELYSLATIVALLSVVIMYYYFKVIKLMYFDSYQENAIYSYSKKGNMDIIFTIYLMLAFTLGFIFILNPLVVILEKVVVIF